MIAQIDPLVTTLLALFGGAISTLFGAYSLVQNNRVQRLDDELKSVRSQLTAVQGENAEYVAMFVLLQAGNDQELNVARERVAAILRKQRGYG